VWAICHLTKTLDNIDALKPLVQKAYIVNIWIMCKNITICA
jgi:hypothetical protein